MMVRALSGALALAALLVTVYAFRHAYAAALDYQAHRYEMLWQKNDGPTDLAQWERALGWSDRALSQDSDNPFMHLRRSRLLQWYGRLPGVDGEKYRGNLDSARKSVATAVSLHPFSADSISSRAELAAVRGRVDAGLNEDIVLSLQMGPWERDVYLRALRAGLFNWPRLDDETRSALRGYFDRTVNHKPRVANEILAIAADYGRLQLFCARLAYLQSAGLTDFSSQRCVAG